MNHITWEIWELGLKAKQYLQDFLEAQKQPASGRTQSQPVKWSPLTQVEYKANFDRAVFSEISMAGIQWS